MATLGSNAAVPRLQLERQLTHLLHLKEDSQQSAPKRQIAPRTSSDHHPWDLFADTLAAAFA